MSERPRGSKWVLAFARWALLFGLIGVGAVASVWLRGERASGEGADALLLLGTAFLALAFVLAPFVRNAFGLPSLSRRRSRSTYRTRLDELREGSADTELSEEQPEKLTGVARAVIALYLLFAGVLIAALTML